MKKITPGRVLAIVAHPDDMEYYCGGTIAAWSQAGCRVTFLLTTSGDKGSNDLSLTTESLVRIREEEQQASAQLLGVAEVRFLRYPDSELDFQDPDRLRGEYVRAIRQFQPEVVITHDPQMRTGRQHPDHRLVGRLVRDASFPLAAVARCYPQHILEEGLAPHQPNFLFLFGTDQPNYWVDIEGVLARKIAALEKHASQAAAFAGGVAQRLRWRAQAVGARGGLQAAEEYLVVQVGPSLPGQGAN